MPSQVEIWDTGLPPEQNPVLMFQVDVVEAMRREPTRFTYDEADYQKRKPSKAEAKKANAAAEEAKAADPTTALDTQPVVDPAVDAQLTAKQLRDRIEELSGKRPTNFVSVDDLRTTYSQLNPGTLDSRNVPDA